MLLRGAMAKTSNPVMKQTGKRSWCLAARVVGRQKHEHSGSRCIVAYVGMIRELILFALALGALSAQTARQDGFRKSSLGRHNMKHPHSPALFPLDLDLNNLASTRSFCLAPIGRAKRKL
jgi:hypothetical protein